MFTLTEFKTAHVVYHVKLFDQSLYVGACSLADLPNVPDMRRNSAWKEVVSRERTPPPHDITVLGIVSSATAAAQVQAGFVAMLKPYANLNGKDDPNASTGRRTGPVRCVDTGDVYPTAAAAAKALGVTHSAMSGHLNDKQPSVRGRRFVYHGTI